MAGIDERQQHCQRGGSSTLALLHFTCAYSTPKSIICCTMEDVRTLFLSFIIYLWIDGLGWHWRQIWRHRNRFPFYFHTNSRNDELWQIQSNRLIEAKSKRFERLISSVLERCFMAWWWWWWRRELLTHMHIQHNWDFSICVFRNSFQFHRRPTFLQARRQDYGNHSLVRSHTTVNFNQFPFRSQISDSRPFGPNTRRTHPFFLLCPRLAMPMCK